MPGERVKICAIIWEGTDRERDYSCLTPSWLSRLVGANSRMATKGILAGFTAKLERAHEAKQQRLNRLPSDKRVKPTAKGWPGSRGRPEQVAHSSDVKRGDAEVRAHRAWRCLLPESEMIGWRSCEDGGRRRRLTRW